MVPEVQLFSDIQMILFYHLLHYTFYIREKDHLLHHNLFIKIYRIFTVYTILLTFSVKGANNVKTGTSMVYGHLKDI